MLDEADRRDLLDYLAAGYPLGAALARVGRSRRWLLTQLAACPEFGRGLAGTQSPAASLSPGTTRHDLWVAVGRCIAHQRRRLGLSQLGAARQAGLTADAWWQVENGKQWPLTDDLLTRIGDALRLDVVAVLARYGLHDRATDLAANRRPARDRPPPAWVGEPSHG